MLSFCIFMFRRGTHRASISFRWYVCVFQVRAQTLFAAVCSFSWKRGTTATATTTKYTFFSSFFVRFAFVHSFRNFSCSFFSSLLSIFQLSTLLLSLPFYLKTRIYRFYRYCLWFRFNSIRFPIVHFCFFIVVVVVIHFSIKVPFFLSYKIVEKNVRWFSMMYEDMVKGLPLF